MSNTQHTPAVAGSQLLKLESKLAELDQFAENNNLALLTEGKGGFTAAIAMADAIGQLKAMLTPEIMQPIMALQGTTLGFKTDKDKEGGYPMEVVRDVMITATLRGFKMVLNHVNIIGGNFYAAKDGLEDWILRASRRGDLTDFRDGYSVPKYISDQEAHVNVSATWVWKGKADSMKDVPLAIRVNKGQGADAILGKAKRKLLARVISRVTGTVLTDGEAGDAIDVETTPVSGTSGGGTSGAAPTGPAPATDEQKAELKKLLEPHADKATAFLLAQKRIPEGGSYLGVTAKMATQILDRPKDFLAAIGAS
jgi:hypothetical protein